MDTNADQNYERLGKVLVTNRARLSLSQSDLATAIRQHFRDAPNGDQPRRRISCADDKPGFGFRLLSVHRTARNQRFLLITEADLSSTKVLLLEEF